MLCLAALSFVLVAIASPLPGEKDWTGYSFEQYVKDFQKDYPGENGDRQANFEAMLQRVLDHNKQENKTWFATVNRFSDMSSAEFKAFVKGRLPIPSWTGNKELEDGMEPSSLPDSVDWRQKKGVVTKVKDQGDCGGCWAFSSTESMESHLAIAMGQDAPVLSVQQIIDCTPNPKQCGGTGGCNGATQPLAFNYTSTIGLATDYDYPYEGQTDDCRDTHMKPVVINSGYVELPANDYTSLMTAVATKGPISISIAASSLAFQMYGGGVGGCGTGDKAWDMDHAVQLVGYGSDEGKDYWLVRNSWNADWGEHGYIRIHRYGEGKEPCGTDKTPGDGDACKGDTAPRKICGECGILSASSYPTGVKKIGPAPGPAPKPHKGNICRKISKKNACQKCEYENDCGFDPSHTLCLSNDPDCDKTGDDVQIV